MDYPGNLFVVAAPSGAGKSSLVKALLAVDGHIQHSVSHTTRAPRGQEMDGREYHFVTPAHFDDMIANNAFFEWAHVHGNKYGTSRQDIEQRMTKGDDVVLEIDYQGAFNIKKLFPRAILVFVLPPSWEQLRARIEGRGEDPADRIALRMRNAEDEMAQAKHFDFVIINDSFEQALLDLKAIVHTHRLTYTAQQRGRAATFKALGLD
jgi:guanylate kinase